MLVDSDGSVGSAGLVSFAGVGWLVCSAGVVGLLVLLVLLVMLVQLVLLIGWLVS